MRDAMGAAILMIVCAMLIAFGWVPGSLVIVLVNGGELDCPSASVRAVPGAQPVAES